MTSKKDFSNDTSHGNKHRDKVSESIANGSSLVNNQLTRSMRRLLKSTLNFLLFPCLRSCENLACRRADGEKVVGPVFIIGPPRSGTTLLYEAMVHRFRFTYLTNIHNRYCRFPAFVTLLNARRIERARKPQYHSAYGVIEGRYAPSECGQFWYRWFPRAPNVYVPAGGLPERSIEELRRSVAGIQRAAGMPVLFKNTYNTMRIGPLIDAFPNARFLVCWRDPVDTAQSILIAREKQRDSKETWVGVPPREFEEIQHGTPEEQVVDQTFFVEKQIADDRESFGGDRFLEVRYEDLCKRPDWVMQGIKRFLANSGINLEKRGTLPNHFSFSTGCKVPMDEHTAITTRVREQYGIEHKESHDNL